MIATLDRPRLRPLSGRRIEHLGHEYLALTDPLGAFRDSVLIPIATFQNVVRHFDGSSDLDQIRGLVERSTGSKPPLADLEALVADLDRRLVLDGPSFARLVADYAIEPTRPPAMAGRSYPADPDRLKADLDRTFADPAGAGRASSDRDNPSAPLRGVLSPHIDFGRGGPTYSWAYRELAERSDADVFVILGVAHQYCGNRFALTRKDFQPPRSALARTDQAFVNRILPKAAGSHLVRR